MGWQASEVQGRQEEEDAMHYCDLHSLTTDLKFPCSSFLNIFVAYGNKCYEKKKTLPKALRTQALTALTSNFGLVGLVQYAW